MMRRIVFLLYLLLPLYLFSEVAFTGLNLSSDNQLLFTAQTFSPDLGDYSTGFQADLYKKTIKQLTFFPESAVLLQNEEQLQIQNRFGVFRTDLNLENITTVDKFSSFINGSEISSGKISKVGASPDGNYLLYLRAVSHAYADLYLFDVKGQKEVKITSRAKLSFSGPGASWSPDSSFFIYEKAGNLYYYSIEQYLGRRLISEDYRKLGTGGITSIQWSSRNYLYYVSGSLVYQILSAEFFTRSLYSDLLKVGEIIGKFPFQFDPAFDSFKISPDGTKILLNKSGQNLFLYYLRSNDYSIGSEVRSLPYLFLPRNTVIKKVLWSSLDLITILTSKIENGEKTTTIYRLDLREESDALVFGKLNDTGINDIIPSTNYTYVALLKDDEVRLKNYARWSDYSSISHIKPLHCLWRGEEELIIAGLERIELVDIKSKKRKLISFSQADSAEYDGKSGKTVITFKSNTSTSSFMLGENGLWDPYFLNDFREESTASDSYRVYSQSLVSGPYNNMIMVRNIVGYGTDPLFAYPENKYEPFPATEKAVNFNSFNHGSRMRRREVALVFNAIDGVEGLTTILNILDEYNLKCTFFINGEFIRRHPAAVKEIADSGHEVGSLFFAYFNMTDSRYIINKDFIKQGLARNEDDYYQATGQDLSLLWHAPYYFVNSEIIAASAEMNYVYIGRDVEPLDWLIIHNEATSTTDLIERIVSLKQPGSIIPIRVGLADDGKTDYLFTDLDLLINSLILLGYEIKPVSELIEHAR